MSFPRQSIFRCLFILAFPAISFSSPALALESLDDSELGEMTGQAFINLSTDVRDTADGQIDFTRVNMGLYAEAFLGVDSVKLGTYSRDGNTGSDIDIDNLALGYIDQTGDDDPNNDYRFENGTWVLQDTDPTNDRVVPFKIKDPYFEFAYKDGELIGWRTGFGEYKGVLSGDVNQLSGNLDVRIAGKAEELRPEATGLLSILFGFGLLSGNEDIEAFAKLVDGNPDSPNHGTEKDFRSGYVGIPNGQGSQEVGGGGLVAAVPAEHCDLAGLSACFPLSLYQSLTQGDFSQSDPDGGIAGGARGMFISVQNELIPWPDLVPDALGNLDPNRSVIMSSGATINIPRYYDDNGTAQYPLNTTFEQAFNGIERLLTCYGGGDC